MSYNQGRIGGKGGVGMHFHHPTFSTIFVIDTIYNFSIFLNFSDDTDSYAYALSTCKSKMSKKCIYLVKDFGLGVKKIKENLP